MKFLRNKDKNIKKWEKSIKKFNKSFERIERENKKYIGKLGIMENKLDLL